ncbi:MAG: HEAT repeat domain-containing protein [Simkaniaceae bacterium]|nr:HEAT repeat domain-containing protein [Simkaniaceae bacterium]MCF7852001.1 HEAT repeat domain-containing protein [Simkaniaceae bacterium]
MQDNDGFPLLPLLDAMDVEILMHRDAHFGSNFDVMLDYYEEGGVGVVDDFEIKRIKELQAQEKAVGQNLSEILMPLPAQQIVERAKKLYHDLRDVYATASSSDSMPCLMSDLILSEEEVPQEEMEKLVALGKKVTKPLIHLLNSDVFYDPLFPGYGRVPIFAAQCLAKIQDESVIPFLFSALNQDNFFTDEEIIKALLSFGAPAKDFLIKRLVTKPYTKDNEHAIITLSSLGDDPEVAHVALSVLEDEEMRKHEAFCIYLIFTCSGLMHEKERARFKALLSHSDLSEALKKEMKVVINHWK